MPLRPNITESQALAKLKSLLGSAVDGSLLLLPLLPENNAASGHTAMLGQDRCEIVECEYTQWYRASHLFVYPVLLALCMAGNALNILVYSEHRLRKSNTIRLLLVKAIANIGYLASLTTTFPKSLTENGGAVDELFWWTYPVALFLANTFGCLATWLTTALTVDTFICFVFPSRQRQFCTMRNSNIAVIVFVILSSILNLYHPVVKVAERVDCPHRNSSMFRVFMREFVPDSIEKAYHWTNAVAVIILPFICMIALSVVILTHICSHPQGRFNKLKKCVLRINLSTTLTHLVLEGPQVVVFIAAAVRDSNSNSPNSYSDSISTNVGSDLNNAFYVRSCNIVVVTNFLSMANAALPFLLYVAASGKFRQVLWHRLPSCRLFGQLNKSNGQKPQGVSGEKEPLASMESCNSATINSRTTSVTRKPTLLYLLVRGKQLPTTQKTLMVNGNVVLVPEIFL